MKGIDDLLHRTASKADQELHKSFKIFIDCLRISLSIALESKHFDPACEMHLMASVITPEPLPADHLFMEFPQDSSWSI